MTNAATIVEADDDETARLRELLTLAADHTQAELAERYHVTPRTIRRWLSRAREMGLSPFRSLSAEVLAARAERELDDLADTLRATLASTRAARDVAALVRELRAIEVERIAIRERLGLVAPPASAPAEPAPSAGPQTEEEARVEFLRTMLPPTLWPPECFPGAVARLVGIGGGVVSGLPNPNEPGAG